MHSAEREIRSELYLVAENYPIAAVIIRAEIALAALTQNAPKLHY